MAFWRAPVPLVFRALKPEVVAIQGDSLGARLRRRRRELHLRRIDAAAIIGADEKSLMWWERDEREPFVHHYPGVIRFLGYEPWPEPKTLPDSLLAERRRRGWTLAQAAETLGVDEGTWRRWEIGEWWPMSRAQRMLDALLGLSVRERYPRGQPNSSSSARLATTE